MMLEPHGQTLVAPRGSESIVLSHPAGGVTRAGSLTRHSIDLSRVATVETEPGELPPSMAASVIREERQGELVGAFQLEEIDIPEPGVFEVIVRVMAAGVNFNNVASHALRNHDD
jgi:hypothetical protein